MNDRLLIKKDGKAKYLSHLDLMRTMQRSFLRAGIKIKHTEGFNPHPYISFALPLSVGTGSICELMDFELTGGALLRDVPELLNSKLPDGIEVLAAYKSGRKLKYIRWLKVQCSLEYDRGVTDDVFGKLRELYNADTLTIEKKSKRGVNTVDIAPLYRDMTWERVSDKELAVTVLLSAQEPSLSPAVLMSAIEQKQPELQPDFIAFQRLEVYDDECKVFR